MARVGGSPPRWWRATRQTVQRPSGGSTPDGAEWARSPRLPALVERKVGRTAPRVTTGDGLCPVTDHRQDEHEADAPMRAGQLGRRVTTAPAKAAIRTAVGTPTEWRGRPSKAMLVGAPAATASAWRTSSRSRRAVAPTSCASPMSCRSCRRDPESSRSSRATASSKPAGGARQGDALDLRQRRQRRAGLREP